MAVQWTDLHRIKFLVTDSCLHSSSTGLLALLAFAFIILFALIVAAMGGGGLILAQRLQSLLDISAASPFAWRQRLCRCPDSVCNTLRKQRTGQMQPSALPVYPSPWVHLSPSARRRVGNLSPITPPVSSAAPAQVAEPLPEILTPAVLAPLPQAAVPERQLPTAPAVETLSSESIVPTLLR